MGRVLYRCLWFLFIGVVSPVVSTAAESCGPFEPADHSDARLPAGIESIRWGMNAAAVEALRGRALERYPDPSQEDVFQLHETLLEEESPTVTIRYTFYEDRLMEVTQFLRPIYIDLPESKLLLPYTEDWGPHAHVETVRSEHAKRAIDRKILEKNWTWCDRFTQLALVRDLVRGEVYTRRISRMIAAQMSTDLRERHERDTWNQVRELPTK